MLKEDVPFQKVTAPATPVPVTDDPDAQVTILFDVSKHNADPDPVPKLFNVTKDDVAYELRRFLELVSTGNPNVLELLFLPEKCIIDSSK